MGRNNRAIVFSIISSFSMLLLIFPQTEMSIDFHTTSTDEENQVLDKDIDVDLLITSIEEWPIIYNLYNGIRH